MIREATVRSTQAGAPVFRPLPEREADGPGAASRHRFAGIRVLAQPETAAEPADAPTPVPAPAEPAPAGPAPAEPAPAQPTPAATATASVPAHIRHPASPAGTPDRIPPRVDTEVAVGVTGADATSPVTLSVEGAGRRERHRDDRRARRRST